MSAHEREDETQEEQYCNRRDGRPLSEAEIDYIVMGTFPASDPPSWTLGVTRRAEPVSRHSGEESLVEKP